MKKLFLLTAMGICLWAGKGYAQDKVNHVRRQQNDIINKLAEADVDPFIIDNVIEACLICDKEKSRGRVVSALQCAERALKPERQELEKISENKISKKERLQLSKCSNSLMQIQWFVTKVLSEKEITDYDIEVSSQASKKLMHYIPHNLVSARY